MPYRLACTYDALGRLKQAKDDDSLVEFTYDSLGRVLTKKQGDNPFGTSAKTVSYSQMVWQAAEPSLTR